MINVLHYENSILSIIFKFSHFLFIINDIFLYSGSIINDGVNKFIELRQLI